MSIRRGALVPICIAIALFIWRKLGSLKKIRDLQEQLANNIEKQKTLLRQEKGEKEALLEFLSEGVIVINREREITTVNPLASRMLGIPKRMLLGKYLLAFRDKPCGRILEKGNSLLESCLERGIPVTGSYSEMKEKRFYLDLIAIPKADCTGAILILQDKSNEYKVVDIGKAFIANASHELRTPITIIKGFAETLNDMPQLPTEMVSDIIDKILRNCQRMENLVKNLLILADIENLPKTRIQEWDLTLLIDECCKQLHSFSPEAKVYVQKNKQKMNIAGDRDLVELAVMNLLHNAIKYSPSPAKIEIELVARHDEIELAVGDQGVGIPDADLEHVFERFYTVDKAHSRKLGGAGLGLAIVKTIVEKHDGTIAVHSKVGSGTTFTLTLPTLFSQ